MPPCEVLLRADSWEASGQNSNRPSNTLLTREKVGERHVHRPTMSWRYGGGGSRKRGRPDMVCQECEEVDIYTEDDEWAVCGECQRVMCEDCMKSTCGVCEADCDWQTEGPSMCEMCTTSCPECSKSEDEEGSGAEGFYCHNICLAEHHRTCNAKSRSQRKISSLTESIGNKKSELARSKGQLESIQKRVAILESEISRAEEEKDKIEKQEQQQQHEEEEESDCKPGANDKK